jgi:hypothetical protein
VINWFGHTATAPSAAVDQINTDLAGYAASVRSCAPAALGDRASVCVSGSLARGEPAVRARLGRYELSSDVDLVAVVDDPTTARGDVEAFTQAMLDRHPKVETTCFVVGRRDLSKVAGRFGADLHHAAAVPLAGPPADGVGAPRVGTREGLEGLTHHLAAIYCPDSLAGATPWRIKTVLEALRAVAVRDECGPQRYSSLVTDRCVIGLIGADVVTDLVRAREHDWPLPITTCHAYHLVISAAATLFGGNDHHDLIAGLHRVEPGLHLLDGFQHAVLAATILLYGPTGLRCNAAAALHVVLAAIDRDTVSTSRPALEALTRISPAEFRHSIDYPNQVVRQHLQALRADYYGWLGPHNFGARPVANYRGPARGDTSIERISRHA